MKINVPGMAAQQRFIFEAATKAGIEQLEKNLQAPVIDDLELDERQYSHSHLLSEDRWEPPHPDLVHAYIDQLKRHSEYTSDAAIVQWLGLKGNNAERRLRSYKTGENKPPYGIWRKILVATGRVPQEIEPVIAFMRGKVED
ncbi:hypothetical protein [Leucothrix mucor]|uniref:hypothetical protein n=1 Tax=Leucothrix mucor TaxID=45248 RepID=UPI0003B4012C|nr:hypothetical protein [Leucothrix mucor]